MPSLGGAASGALKGASTGATIGSIVPGLGTLVGGGLGAAIGGIAGLFKKKKKPTDAAAVAPAQGAEGTLQANADESQQTGEENQDEGTAGLNTVLQHYKGLLDDPQQLAAATRGARGRVIDQYDAARKSIGQFAPRGGGANAAIANSYTQQGTALQDTLSEGENAAAQGLASTGSALASIGMSDKQLASSDLNSVISAALTRRGQDIEKSGQNKELWGGIGQGVGSLVGAFLTRNKGASS